MRGRGGRFAGRVLALALLGAHIGGAASGCRGGVVAPSVYDQAWEIKGTLTTALPAGTNPIAGVVWTDPLQRGDDLPMPARSIESNVALAGDPPDGGRFVIGLHGPPPAAALFEIPSPSGNETAVIAMGELVIVDDADRDGTFRIDRRGTIAAPADGGTPGDRYLGGSVEVVVFVARTFSAAVPSSRIAPLTQLGYQLRLYRCAGRIPEQQVAASGATFELQTSRELVERRTCLRTHTP